MSKVNDRSSQPIDPVRYSRRTASIEPSNRVRRTTNYNPIDPVRYSRRLPSFQPRIKCTPCMDKAVSTTLDKAEENPRSNRDHDNSDKERHFEENKGDFSSPKQFEKDSKDGGRPYHEFEGDRSYFLNQNYGAPNPFSYFGAPNPFSYSQFSKPPNDPSNTINQMVFAIKNILEELLNRLKNIETTDCCIKNDMEMLKQRVEKLEKSKQLKSNKSIAVDRSVQSFNEYRHFRKMLMKELQQIQIYDVNDAMVMTLRAIGKQTNQSVDRIFQTAFLNYVDWRFPQIRFQFPAMNFAQIRQMLLNEWRQKAYGKSCNILQWLR